MLLKVYWHKKSQDKNLRLQQNSVYDLLRKRCSVNVAEGLFYSDNSTSIFLRYVLTVL